MKPSPVNQTENSHSFPSEHFCTVAQKARFTSWKTLETDCFFCLTGNIKGNSKLLSWTGGTKQKSRILLHGHLCLQMRQSTSCLHILLCTIYIQHWSNLVENKVIDKHTTPRPCSSSGFRHIPTSFNRTWVPAVIFHRSIHYAQWIVLPSLKMYVQIRGDMEDLHCTLRCFALCPHHFSHQVGSVLWSNCQGKSGCFRKQQWWLMRQPSFLPADLSDRAAEVCYFPDEIQV